ncbi:MAG: DUF6653 family protein [Pseudomonadota bacterium]
MDLFASAERLMGMDDATWRRHANPWSVWTRFTALPLLSLAIWSRVWIGWWSVLAVAAAAVWIWLNPRAFPPPADYGHWTSRGVLGERLWLARDRVVIPAHHVRAAQLTTAVSALGALILLWGLVALDFSATVGGTLLTILGKTWFVDRMVWIHADITGTQPGTPLPDPTLPFEKAAP